RRDAGVWASPSAYAIHDRPPTRPRQHRVARLPARAFLEVVLTCMAFSAEVRVIDRSPAQAHGVWTTGEARQVSGLLLIGWRTRIRTWNKGSKGPCDTISPSAIRHP